MGPIELARLIRGTGAIFTGVSLEALGLTLGLLEQLGLLAVTELRHIALAVRGRSSTCSGSSTTGGRGGTLSLTLEIDEELLLVTDTVVPCLVGLVG